MAKQLLQSVQIKINETDRALLCAMGERAGEPNVRVSVRSQEFADQIQKSAQAVRRSCQKLNEMGLIRRWRRKRPDGSYDVNQYEVTLVGWAVLEAPAERRRS